MGDHPYRTPAQPRPTRSVLDELVSFVCLACVGLGAGGALAGAGYQLAGGGDVGQAFTLAGLLVCFGGAGGAVVMARSGR